MTRHFFAETPLPELYRWFAQEVRQSSPIWHALCLWISDDAGVLALLAELEGMERQPNRLLAALRFLDGPLRGGPELQQWLAEHWPSVRTVIGERTTQTNEPGRLAVLAPVFASLPQPVALLELGASAGLCLLPDLLGPDERPTVAARLGVDLHPLDVTDEDTIRWLRALVWPGEEDREATLARAVATARRNPPEVRACDITVEPATTIPALVDELRRRAPDATPVVFHSTVLGYLARADRGAVVEAMQASGARWVSFEDARVLPEVARRAERYGARPEWAKFVIALDGEPLGCAQPHGRAVRWWQRPS